MAAAHAAAAPYARGFLDFVSKAVTPFHCVKSMSDRLVASGYVRLSEAEGWANVKAGGKYYVTRNESSIIAFEVGGKVVPSEEASASVGIKILGAHTDSPNLALKPKTFASKGAYLDVGVQTYGGGLWHTWFDRELTVAGRVVIDSQSEGGATQLKSKLVNVNKPLMRIPTLAIHLRSVDEREKFGPNKESHVVPVIATQSLAKAMGLEGSENSQSKLLMKAVAEAANCDPQQIVDFDLSVIDTQAPVIGGALDEFIFSPRIDNLVSCYVALEALLDNKSAATDDMIRMIACFDDEEVGSTSANGAAGSFVVDVVDRIGVAFNTTRARITANSFVMSVDGAHGAHPHYLDKHEAEHRPNLHEGPVIKYNANQRYATNGRTAAVVKALAKRVDVPLQMICVKNDSPCGSTIGPRISSLTGIASIDIGNAMLSMHSIRETCGTVDVMYLQQLLTSFFDNYQKVSVTSSEE